MLARIAKATKRETTWFDPDADEEDNQLAVALLALLRLQVREIVRAELSEAVEVGRAD